MPQSQIDHALEQLVAAELLFRRGTLPDTQYTFKHALVQDTAYSTLLRSRRQQLHGGIVTTLESRFPEMVATDPATLAQHCTEAGLKVKAVNYRLKAGQQAVARSAMAEAVAQLEKGLSLLTTMASGRELQQQELELRVALIPALIGTKGYSSSDVGETIARAYALAEQLNKPEYFAPLLYGRWVFNLVRAELSLALTHAERLEGLGKERNDPAVALMGHLCHGIIRFFFGELGSARTLFEQSDSLDLHRQFYSTLSPDDPHLVMLAYLGATLCLQGYLDQGRAMLNEAILEGGRRNHAHTLSLVLRFAAWAAWLVRSPSEEQQHADNLLSLSEEHGFPLWAGWAMVHRGSSFAAVGFPQDGVGLILKGMQIATTVGAVLLRPTGLIMLAEVHGRLGQWANAGKFLDEASLIIRNTDERTHLSDLHRVRGDLLIGSGDLIEGEQSYRQAISVAVEQNAKVQELRAATSLACLWRDQGKRDEARELLAPVYAWFTEGFDTREAKALLAELSS
jgi:tetratricopeptide (TPR) repeat protein